MLYTLYDLHLAAWEPVRQLAKAGEALFSHPCLPISYTQTGRAAAAMCEMVERGTRRYRKPDFGIDTVTIDGRELPVTEERALTEPFCTLLHFAHPGAHKKPRVLIVAPLSGHYATLLRGTVKAMLQSHDVYITDWTDASEVHIAHGPFDLDDYIDIVIAYLEHLGPNTHVMAVCQPSVPVLAAVAFMSADDHPCLPPSMTLMGGPIDTRVNPTQVNELATSRSLDWFERSVISRVPFGYEGAGRLVYPGFLQLTGFMSMNLDRHVGAHMKLFEHLVEGDGDGADAHRQFYDEYMSVMDLPAEYYLQTVKTVFQDHALPEGTMTHRGRPVDLSAIRKTALMTVEGELDDISGVGQTRAAHDLCSSIPKSRKRHWEQPETGHYGIFNGRKWREIIMPKVAEHIRASV